MGQDRDAEETLDPDIFEGGVDRSCLMEKMIVRERSQVSFASFLFKQQEGWSCHQWMRKAVGEAGLGKRLGIVFLMC